MSDYHFLSYSTADAEPFALELTDHLLAGPPSIRIWLDKRDLNPIRDWDEQVAEAIEHCDSLLFVMTADSVEPQSECKREWTRALRYNRPVVPILLHADVEVPFRLGPRQYIDFTEEFETGLAKLRRHLQWLASPEGRTENVRQRLRDHERDLRRARTEGQKSRIQDRIQKTEQELRDVVHGRTLTKPLLESDASENRPDDSRNGLDDESLVRELDEHRDIYGAIDTEAPPPDIWFRSLRPLLHQASHYSIPTYYLDQNLKVIDWNVAFELIFSDLVGAIRYKHVNWFIVRLDNHKQSFDHARRFTARVRRGVLPLVDLEPLRYSSRKYGNILFEKVASPLHDSKGRIRGWTVGLMVREINWRDFLKDLRAKLWQDKLWSLYSASYDPILLQYEPYRALIKDIISVVPGEGKAVVDLGAGSGNVTSALLEKKHQVTAVENNLAMLDRLRSKRFDPRLTTIAKGSVEHLDMLGKESFDAAVMMNVLYAVDDPLACLCGVREILKPNGFFAYSTTHSGIQLSVLLDDIKRSLVEAGEFGRLAEHYDTLREANEEIERTIALRFTRKEYLEWTTAAGFELIDEPRETYQGAVVLVRARRK